MTAIPATPSAAQAQADRALPCPITEAGHATATQPSDPMHASRIASADHPCTATP